MLSFVDATCLPGIRRWLRANVAGEDLMINAQLVCTELVTNAVEHGGGRGTVRIDLVEDDGLHVEVDDRDPAAALTIGRSRLGGVRGRGLQIVTAMAEWGVTRRTDGKTVWASL
ncbi:ATP-binding protein [Pseudonocardia ailaonensis]|uniref:ATP-binding protein n=1 Tax=Pseudonocardia ailaonensis TaxID=367279 RepID=UPI0031D6C35D